MAEWRLTDAEEARRSITSAQEKEIAKLYRRVYQGIRKQIQAIPKNGNISSRMRKQYLEKLQSQLDEAYKELRNDVKKTVEDNIEKAAQAVADSTGKFLKDVGLTIEGAYSFVPKDIVTMLSTGQLYQGNWSLSKALWKDVQKHQFDINRIIAEGVAANKSAYDIAKDLEKYVDPSARKEWDWSKVYPGTNKKVDYNAQRLARTMVSHAYQQSLERVCKNNPFVSGYIWQSAHSSRVCPICANRDGQFYKKGELPLDHPNGVCTFIAEIEGSMKDVGERLGDWVNGKEDSNLDNWYQDLMRENVQRARSENSKALNATFSSLKVGTNKFRGFNAYYRKAFEDLWETDEDLYRAIAESYTGGEYISMNQYLRTGKFNKDDLVQLADKKELVAEIEYAKRAISGIKCPENITVYRRTKGLGDIAGSTKGSTYTSKAFLSSTLDPKAYRSYDDELFDELGKVQVEIKIPKDYDKGAFIHSISMQDNEYEFLFAPDTEFEVVEISKTKVVLLAK